MFSRTWLIDFHRLPITLLTLIFISLNRQEYITPPAADGHGRFDTPLTFRRLQLPPLPPADATASQPAYREAEPS
jgi:hypothetical protein